MRYNVLVLNLSFICLINICKVFILKIILTCCLMPFIEFTLQFFENNPEIRWLMSIYYFCWYFIILYYYYYFYRDYHHNHCFIKGCLVLLPSFFIDIIILIDILFFFIIFFKIPIVKNIFIKNLYLILLNVIYLYYKHMNLKFIVF